MFSFEMSDLISAVFIRVSTKIALLFWYLFSKGGFSTKSGGTPRQIFLYLTRTYENKHCKGEPYRYPSVQTGTHRSCYFIMRIIPV